MLKRQIFYVSDGTGISAQVIGNALLTQFDDLDAQVQTLTFVKTIEQTEAAVAQIKAAADPQGWRPIIVSTLVDAQCSAILQELDAFHIDVFSKFITPLENELGMSSTHKLGRSHGKVSTQRYTDRIDSVNFALAYDDGAKGRGLEQADVILVGVSRSGKTPTSLYLALNYGVKAANYPLIPEDFDRGVLPEALLKHADKLFGLTIRADRLHAIRSERMPDSSYSGLLNCRKEIQLAEQLMRRNGIEWINSTSKSIEELSASVIKAKGLPHVHY